ncbi:MAG TPA: hypothetical protein PLP42_18930 [Acidobacteriota bacterium]|nr:hypothetical protein [Acidobacteriota bacterium]
MTASDADVSVRNHLTAASSEARLVINARLEMTPESLEQIVRKTLDQVAAGQVVVRIVQLQSLSPGRPIPTHRYVNIVW